jgi:hypothetical protein
MDSGLSLLSRTIWAIMLLLFLHNALSPNPNTHVSAFLSACLHPNKRRGPNSHCDTHRDHSPHTSSEVRSKVRAVEDNGPPSINSIGSSVHGSYDNSAEAVFFVAKYVVGPGEEGRLAGVYRARPVVHNEMDGCVLQVGEDEGRCYDASYADPVPNFVAVRWGLEGEVGR